MIPKVSTEIPFIINLIKPVAFNLANHVYDLLQSLNFFSNNRVNKIRNQD